MVRIHVLAQNYDDGLRTFKSIMLKTNQYNFTQEVLSVPAGEQELLVFKKEKSAESSKSAGGKVVVYIHGYNRFGGWEEAWTADHILANGYTAVLPSQLGFGKSIGERDYCGPNTCESIALALKDFCEREEISSDCLVIWGHSRGALIAATIAVTYPDLAAAYICQSGAYDFEKNHNNPNRPDEIKQNVIKETNGASADEVRKRSPVFDVQNVTKPILIIHGDLDETVGVDQAYALEEALKGAGKKYEMHILEGSNHFTGRLSKPIAFEFIESIFAKN